MNVQSGMSSQKATIFVIFGFFNTDRKNKNSKDIFKLFFMITDNWNHVNKNVVDEYFNLLEPNNHDFCKKV